MGKMTEKMTGEKRIMEHSRKSKNVMRQAISYTLAFLLAVCITLITLLFIIRFGAFNEKIMYSNMSSHGYYDYIYEDFMEDVKAATLPTGFPERIFEGVVTKTDVYNDVNGSLKAQLGEKEFSSQSQQIKQRLRQNIEAYFVETEYTATEEEQTAINEYVNTVANNYDKYIKMPLGSYLLKAKQIFGKVFGIALTVLAVVSAVILFVLFKLHRWKHRTLRFYSYAAFGSAVMVVAYPAYLYAGKAYYRLNLSPESFYNFAITYLDNILELFLYSGLFWLVMGIVLVCLSVFLKNKSKKRKKA